MNDTTATETMNDAGAPPPDRPAQLPAVTEQQRSITEVMAANSAGVANMLQLIKVADLMSKSGPAVPAHCQKAPELCWAICLSAQDWGFKNPIALANKSYVVGGRLAWESQVVHAVIERNAPMEGRMRHEYINDDGLHHTKSQLQVKIIMVPKGENVPLEYLSPKACDIKTKNSPLWEVDLRLQMFYYASRSACRMHFPEVLLGAWTQDEAASMEPMRDVTPAKPTGLVERLQSQRVGDEGFDHEHVEDGVASAHVDGNGAAVARATPAANENAGASPGAATATTATGHAGTGKATAPKKGQGGAKAPAKAKAAPAATAKAAPAKPAAKAAAKPKGKAADPAPAAAAAPAPAKATAAKEPSARPEPAPAAAAATPPAEPEPEGEPPTPKDPPQYAEHVLRWLQPLQAAEVTKDGGGPIRQKWFSERPLRNTIGLTQEDRKDIETVVMEAAEAMDTAWDEASKK